MNLKWLGFAICSAILIVTWWLFSPQSTFKRENISTSGERGIAIRPLTISDIKPIAPPKSPLPQSPPPSQEVNMKPLTNNEIEDVFAHHQRQFQNCWVQRLKDNPELKGTVSFRVTISPRGKVSETQLSNSEIDDTLMLQCLSSTLSRLSFREFRGDPIEVLFPLEFEF